MNAREAARNRRVAPPEAQHADRATATEPRAVAPAPRSAAAATRGMCGRDVDASQRRAVAALEARVPNSPA